MSNLNLQPAFQKPVASLRHTAILLLVILGITLFGAYSQSRSLSVPTGESQSGKAILYLSVIALQYGLLRLIVGGLRRYGISLRDLIGENATRARNLWLDVIIAAIFWIVGVGALTLLKQALGGDDNHVGSLLPHGVLESVLWIMLSIAAGFVEEICYRGYLQKQLLAVTGSVAVAVLAQGLLFGISHSYQGLKSVMVISVYGVMFGVLAHLRGSLRPGMIAHAWTDIASSLLR